MSDPLDDMTPEEERALTEGLMAAAMQHVAALGFVKGAARTPSDIDNNGTASFLELPDRQVVITSHHVLAGFRRYQVSKPTAEMILVAGQGQQPIVVRGLKVIAEDLDHDLAVFTFDGQEEIARLGLDFYKPKAWPLKPAAAGDSIVMVGYPGARRYGSAAINVVKWEAVLLNPTAFHIGPYFAYSQFQNPEPIIQKFSRRGLTYDWGGMSGCMAYRLDEATDQFHVVGFLESAPTGLSGYFRISRGDHLNGDGTIGRP